MEVVFTWAYKTPETVVMRFREKGTSTTEALPMTTLAEVLLSSDTFVCQSLAGENENMLIITFC